MLQITEQEGKRIHIVAKGKLRASDYEAVVPELDRRIEHVGKLRALVDLRGLEGMEPAAWIEEAKFDARHRRDFERCAVVGDKEWERVATQVAAPLFRGDVRFFDAADVEEAERWVDA